MSTYLKILASALICLLFVSCSTGPAPPEKGTPAFYWSAAKETFVAVDYLKTSDHLESLGKSQNEFSNKAQPWRMVLANGLAKGFTDLADYYEYGARAAKTNPAPFRKQVADYRTMANRAALSLAESFQVYQKSAKDPEIVLAFPFPSGNASRSQLLTKTSTGVLLESGEMDEAVKRSLERGVLLSACDAVGAAGDVPKAQAIFKAGEVKIPRATFTFAMAKGLYDASQLYVRARLDQPEKLKLLCQQAADALKEVPASKETKALDAKIQAALKTKKG